MRALLVGALALTLIGCSRQPSPLVSETCNDASGTACVTRSAVGPPMRLASFRSHSVTARARSKRTRSSSEASARPSHEHVRVRPAIRLVAKRAKPPAKPSAAKDHVPPPLSRVPLPPPKTQPAPASAPTSVADASRVQVVDAHPTEASAVKSETVEQQVVAAAAAAERMSATALPKARANDRPDKAETVGRADVAKAAAAAPDNTDLLVAILMTRPDIKSVSELSRKTIAIDDRHAASSGTVRTAIVAAGAPEAQLSEGQMTAINRLTNGEVPAAVVALVSPDAAETFPEIAGFKVFQVPLSPKSVRAKP